MLPALTDDLMASRMGNEMGKSLDRHCVAVPNFRLHGGRKGHELVACVI